ncbi:MAG: LLM class flavin-dependent oxidoreductase, partial [Actinobacteria bacterium]|nr:LLM class flavin-dependent oxidoreductase [Actinomycetota bacterium]
MRVYVALRNLLGVAETCGIRLEEAPDARCRVRSPMAYTVFRLNHVHPDPSDGSEMSDRYRAALDMVEFLDQRGLNAVQFDEHHVSSTGWSPTPMMSAGMVLARTENVLCMIGALLLPLHDPIRVAEDLAVLDLVGKGRIVVTMGLGYRPL